MSLESEPTIIFVVTDGFQSTLAPGKFLDAARVNLALNFAFDYAVPS